MGVYSSAFAVEAKDIIKLKPTDPNWLFKHAESCMVPFSEVQRCWRRFTLIGANKKGVLTQNSKIWKTDDKFMQQVSRMLPWSSKGTLSFQVYLKVVKWFENLEEVEKLKVIYLVINRGQAVDSDITQRVLKHVYPTMTEDDLFQSAKSFVEKVDHKRQGSIDEEEFIEFAKQVSFEEMSKLLNFKLIPEDVELPV
ncbi:uncharacterized protein LOC143459026 [Clavelina lepadiformis]|uniref:uncharacterized protein LOC143459026 n=1 Tax=Clavelina lepadiformis TaxID=159417 RepID=UPI0040427EB4